MSKKVKRVGMDGRKLETHAGTRMSGRWRQIRLTCRCQASMALQKFRARNVRRIEGPTEPYGNAAKR